MFFREAFFLLFYYVDMEPTYGSYDYYSFLLKKVFYLSLCWENTPSNFSLICMEIKKDTAILFAILSQ